MTNDEARSEMQYAILAGNGMCCGKKNWKHVLNSLDQELLRMWVRNET